MINNFPSIDPADNDSLVGTLKFTINKLLQDHDDMIPARVIAVEDGFVQVQPMIFMITTGGEQITRAQIAKVPVLKMGGGGFVLSFPIKEGDLGFIKANDRDISIFMQDLDDSPPGTIRQHSFSDSIFIPHVFTGYTVDNDNVVLQNLSGSVKISLGDTQIDITAPTVNINGSDVVVTTTNSTINATGTTTVNSDTVNIDGTTVVNIDSDALVKLTAPVVNVNGTIF